MYGIPLPPPTSSLDPPQATTTTSPRRRQRNKPSILSLSKPLESIKHLLFNHEECYDIVAWSLLLWESGLLGLIIWKIPYTEIDFKTYLEQSRLFVEEGERDYSMIKGPSGLCVYPAGHLYFYSFIYYLTSQGRHIERAQALFGLVYLMTLGLVMRICKVGKRIPPYALIFLTLSKRIHSLYVLRMFNDCIAMLFLYSALYVYTTSIKSPSTTSGSEQDARKDMEKKRKNWDKKIREVEEEEMEEMEERRKREVEERKRLERRWILASCLFSLALSIKMSILLFLPALLYLTFVYLSPLSTILHLSVISLIQIIISIPFSSNLNHAKLYWSQSFDFTRTFEWEWTVNWRWIGVEVFEDDAFGKLLLMGHVVGLAGLAWRWCEEEGGVEKVLKRGWRKPGESPAMGKLTKSRIITFFFLSNFIGILFSRSLHYQFYTWFYHHLVWILFETTSGIEVETIQKLVLTSLIEYGFHQFPSTINSSIGFVLGLLCLLGICWYGNPAGEQGEPLMKDQGQERKKVE